VSIERALSHRDWRDSTKVTTMKVVQTLLSTTDKIVGSRMLRGPYAAPPRVQRGE
jgi:hypothetical protein